MNQIIVPLAVVFSTTTLRICAVCSLEALQIIIYLEQFNEFKFDGFDFLLTSFIYRQRVATIIITTLPRVIDG